MTARIVRHTILVAVCLFYLFPAFVVIANSFKTTKQYVLGPLQVPWGDLTIENYTKIFQDPSLSMSSAAAFSTLIAGATVFLALAVGGGLSYVLARSNRPLARATFLIIVAGLIVPPEVLIIPVVKVLQFLGLLHTSVGLVLVETSRSLSFVVFVFVPFIRAVPIEIDESAFLDGASRMTIYWRMIFPLTRPAVIAVGVLVFADAWNDFLMPQVLLRPGESYTMTTGIYRGLGLHSTDWSSIFAYMVVAALPVVLLFFILQRFVTKGLMEGAVRG